MDIEVEIADPQEDEPRSFADLRQVRTWYLNMGVGVCLLMLLPVLMFGWFILNEYLIHASRIESMLPGVLLHLMGGAFVLTLGIGAWCIGSRHPDYEGSDYFYSRFIRYAGLIFCLGIIVYQLATIAEMTAVDADAPSPAMIGPLQTMIVRSLGLIVSGIALVGLLIFVVPFIFVLTCYADYQRLKMRYYFALALGVALLLFILSLALKRPFEAGAALRGAISEFLIVYCYQVLVWVMFAWLLMEMIQFTVVVIRRYSQSLHEMELRGIQELESPESI